MSSLPPASSTLTRHIRCNENAFAEKPDPCHHNPKGRIIVISADGTSNEFGNKSTNVVEFHSRVVKDEDQITLYISGIGTYANNKIQRLIDMAFASTFERNVLEAYKWLSQNYRDGDRIFLFGFSRGAYQVRVLAGMIERVGLLYKGNQTQIPSAFKLYMATTEKSSISKMILQKLGIGSAIKTNVKLGMTGSGPGPSMRHLGTPLAKSKEMCATFKKAFSREVKVHFVGVWDTVSSIGLSSGFNLPETVDGMAHVCHFRQALALDERRVRFWPEYADRLDTRAPSPGEGPRSDVKEVWFAGSHSDVGGGHAWNEKLTQFSPALRWMTYEAVAHGLRMTPFGGFWTDHKPRVESHKGPWFILELLPILRPAHLSNDSSQRFRRTRSLHCAAPRHIFDGQRIHESVLDSITNKEWNYQPAARFHGLKETRTIWIEALESQEFRNAWVERDPITSAQHLVEDIKQLTWRQKDQDSDAIIDILEGYASSPMRLRSLAEVKGAVSTLTNHLLFPELERPLHHDTGQCTGPRKEMYSALFVILRSIPPAKTDKIHIARFRDLVSKLPRPDLNILQPCRAILLRHGDGHLFEEPRVCHSSQVLYVAFSDDGGRIFSASSTEVTIFSTGTTSMANVDQLVKVPHHSEEQIKCVAISSNGQYLALGSAIAGVKACKFEPLYHPTIYPEQLAPYKVRRVAFSPNGNTIAAALDDCTIKIWNHWDDSLTGDIRTLEGHRDWIRSLVFSLDGTHLVSGSDDCTIRLWNVEDVNMKNAVKVIEGDGGVIRSVALYLNRPDGEVIQSIRIAAHKRPLDLDANDEIQGPHIAGWNTPEDTTVVNPTPTRVLSVNVKPPPTYTIFFGSDDGAIRIHRDHPNGLAKTEKLEESHSTWIRCIAISPHGDMIASASDDCTICCWEVRAEGGTRTVAIYHVESPVCSIAFSHDGKKLVTGNFLGQIQVWDADVTLY